MCHFFNLNLTAESAVISVAGRGFDGLRGFMTTWLSQELSDDFVLSGVVKGTWLPKVLEMAILGASGNFWNLSSGQHQREKKTLYKTEPGIANEK